jgi:hypothetical protein
MIWYFTFDASMQMMVQESDAAAAAAVTVARTPMLPWRGNFKQHSMPSGWAAVTVRSGSRCA